MNESHPQSLQMYAAAVTRSCAREIGPRFFSPLTVRKGAGLKGRRREAHGTVCGMPAILWIMSVCHNNNLAIGAVKQSNSLFVYTVRDSHKINMLSAPLLACVLTATGGHALYPSASISTWCASAAIQVYNCHWGCSAARLCVCNFSRE